MLVCITKDTFIRTFNNDIGYIYNQLTKKDRIYDANGRFFLNQLTRQPQDIKTIVRNLSLIYPYANTDDLDNDFRDFISDLESEGFVVSGESEQDISASMPGFSYRGHDIKTMPRTDFSVLRDSMVTTEFLAGYFADCPQIFSLQFELTNRCNERCRHCYLPDSRNFRDIDTSLAVSVLDQLVDMGTLNVTFSGGECLLHPDFVQILKHAREKDFSIAILSNITLLNDEIIHSLKDANINSLQVSVYSMNPEEHDYITRLEGSHEKTIRNLERLIEADIPVQISCPTMRSTYRSYREVLKWAYSHGIKAYTDYIMMARTDSTTDNLINRLTLSETEKLLMDIVNYDIEYRNALASGAEPRLTDPNDNLCGAGIDSMCIAVNGDFFPCSGFQSYSLGNAYENSVAEVWNNSEALKKLRNIRWKNFPECLKCEAKPYCSMCMVRNLNETGSIFTVNKHFCDSAFLNMRVARERFMSEKSHSSSCD